jgi:hypothetical protein
LLKSVLSVLLPELLDFYDLLLLRLLYDDLDPIEIAFPISPLCPINGNLISLLRETCYLSSGTA